MAVLAVLVVGAMALCKTRVAARAPPIWVAAAAVRGMVVQQAGTRLLVAEEVRVALFLALFFCKLARQ